MELSLLSFEFDLGLGFSSFLPLFSPCFFSLSAFCFLIHAAVLWLFWLLQNLHCSLSLGMVQAAAICPFFLQARQALSPAAAPEWQILVCLKLSEILDVLSIFTIQLQTCSQVVVSVICSCTFIKTLFSWMVFSRHIINTSSGVIANLSQPLNSWMIV